MHEIYSTEKNISVIIPAFNEGKTIKNVVKIAASHPQVGEVIVVDDGSRDSTVMNSEAAGAKVIVHAKNKGKAAAMDTGVRKAANSIIFFIDGDIIGLTHKMMDAAFVAVQENKTDMYVLITDHGPLFPERFVKALPLIAGLRVMKKSIWYLVPEKYLHKFGIELALNFFAAKHCMRVEAHVFRGLTQIIKERKRGLVWGLYQRMFMIRDLIFAFVRLHIVYNLRQGLRALKRVF